MARIYFYIVFFEKRVSKNSAFHRWQNQKTILNVCIPILNIFACFLIVTLWPDAIRTEVKEGSSMTIWFGMFVRSSRKIDSCNAFEQELVSIKALRFKSELNSKRT